MRNAKLTAHEWEKPHGSSPPLFELVHILERGQWVCLVRRRCLAASSSPRIEDRRRSKGATPPPIPETCEQSRQAESDFGHLLRPMWKRVVVVDVGVIGRGICKWCSSSKQGQTEADYEYPEGWLVDLPGNPFNPFSDRFHPLLAHDLRCYQR